MLEKLIEHHGASENWPAVKAKALLALLLAWLAGRPEAAQTKPHKLGRLANLRPAIEGWLRGAQANSAGEHIAKTKHLAENALAAIDRWRTR